MFVKIFQVCAEEKMGKESKFVQFSTCVISVGRAKHLDATTMFTYSHANTPVGQSERVYYFSHFINVVITCAVVFGLLFFCLNILAN